MQQGQATVVRREEQTKELAPVQVGHDILATIHAAVTSGVGVEGIERLVALHERMQQAAAFRAFNDAMAKFQAECPVITKTSRASFSTSKGTTAGYSYAELDHIAETIRPCLARNGLAYSWDSKVDNGMLVCTCTVTHRDGHSRSGSFVAPIEGQSIMSSAQKAAATLTFARRYSLIQALGLTTGEQDTDDNTPHEPAKPITESQAMTLDSLIDDAKADKAKFLAYYGIQAVHELPADRYQEAVRMLEQRRKAAV